ncbi:MAG: glycoside hydrolase family 3 N-terminal domain-containing protein [Pyrinomonadaceae bacterium]
MTDKLSVRLSSLVMIHSTSSLSIEQKIGQLFFIGMPGPQFDEATRELVDQVSPGGVCLFSRNIREAEQTRQLTDTIRDSLPITPFLSIDQEGGLVDRLRRVMTPMPPASKITSPRQAAEAAHIVADALHTLGLNMDFAPVVDVSDTGRAQYSNGLVSRTFGSSASDVETLAGSFLDALQAGGILGCLKHFPGLGASTVDSHEELPIVEIDDTELHTTDLLPYRGLLTRVTAVMVAHAAFPNSNLQERDRGGKLLPSSLSYNFVTKLLRQELHFGGLVISDDLEMGAIVKNYGMGEACKMAIAAGVDMLAICADPRAIREGFEAVRTAVADGGISTARLDESMERISGAKSRLSQPRPFDSMKFNDLSAETEHLTAKLNR